MANSSTTTPPPRNVTPELPPGGLGTTRTFENTNHFLQLRPQSQNGSRIITFSQLAMSNDYAVGLDTTDANVTLILPPANAAPPQLLRVKWVAGANTAKIIAQSADTIDGSASVTLGSLNASVDLLSVGNNAWWIL